MCKKYKPNNVYVLEIHGCQYYVGCHCCNRAALSELEILYLSGNCLRAARDKKLITSEEYKDCCRLVYIEEFDFKEEALDREAELIQKFQEHYGKLCLNKAKGNQYGRGGCIVLEETKKKISDSNKGKHHNISEEAHQRMLAAHVGHSPWNKGIPCSEETKVKISEKKKGTVCTEEHKKKTSQALKNRPDCSKPVLQFTLDGQFIAEYPSAQEAARQTGIHQSSITFACQGRYKTAGGFIFKYKDTNSL